MEKVQQTSRGHRGPALLSTAKRLFFKRGYLGTTMEKVASDAGFSKRTVYLYFKNKDDLFISVAEQGLLLLRERLEQIDVEDLSVEDGIRTVLEVYLWFARKHAKYFRMIFQEPTPEMVGNVSAELRDRVEHHEKACLSVVARIAEKAVQQKLAPPLDPWDVAGIFWGSITGIILLSMGGSQTVFTRKTLEDLVEKATWTLYAGMRSGVLNEEAKNGEEIFKRAK